MPAGKTQPTPIAAAEVEFGLTIPDPSLGNPAVIMLWRCFASMRSMGQHVDPDEAKKKVWRADLLLGYGHDSMEELSNASVPSENCVWLESKSMTVNPPNILILDDAGFAFRNSPACWMLPTDPTKGPQWIILKMSRPVCRGGLWQALQPFLDRLIVVVSAAELRHESAAISMGLSWIRTVEDLAVAIKSDPILSQLSNCRHLIVNFSADGALWIDKPSTSNSMNGSTTKAELIYDAGSIEGQWSEQTQGEVFGYMSCMVAWLTAAVVQQQSDPGPPAKELSSGEP